MPRPERNRHAYGRRGRPTLAHPGDMAAQVRLALDNLETLLAQADCTLADSVRLQIVTAVMEAFLTGFPAVKAQLDQAACRCAQSLIGVARLAGPTPLVEIEATAALEPKERHASGTHLQQRRRRRYASQVCQAQQTPRQPERPIARVVRDPCPRADGYMKGDGGHRQNGPPAATALGGHTKNGMASVWYQW